MNINWVLSNSVNINPAHDINRLKEIGSFWGGWKTWRACQTDNVICHDLAQARELVTKLFHLGCNFYVPNDVYISLQRPVGVQVYEGKFVHDLENQEDIVAMHLATSCSEIVLLLGFDFSEQIKIEDKLAEHRAHNYRSLTKQVMLNHSNVQWVVVDHPKELRQDLQSLPNLGKDTLSNILSN
jgi:hypothetical protein